MKTSRIYEPMLERLKIRDMRDGRQAGLSVSPSAEDAPGKRGGLIRRCRAFFMNPKSNLL